MLAYPDKLDLSVNQGIADILRQASTKFRTADANAASLFEVAADTIETMCDALKAQEQLIGDLVDAINEGEGHG